MKAYHATIKDFLPGIAGYGLLARYSGAAGEEVIFVEPDYAEAAIYLKPERGVMLRFEVDGIGDTEDGESVLWDTPRIAPERIEVELDGAWTPLEAARNNGRGEAMIQTIPCPICADPISETNRCR